MKQLLFQKTIFGTTPIGITDGKIILRECDSFLADRIIQKYHYSHKTTKNRFKSFSINDGLGYLQLGYGIRPRMKHTISTLIDDKNFCEFDRMWLSDALPKNSESQVIGLLLSYLKQVYKHIKFVITYADESAENCGTIYQATNAIEIDSVWVDFYILPSGERIHPVSMYHHHKTRAWGFLKREYQGIKHMKGKYRQRRYIYILNKGLRKKFQGRNAIHQIEGLGQFQLSAPISKHNESCRMG